MSDGLSDIARDGYRGGMMNRYYVALQAWLDDPDDDLEGEKAQAVRKAAEDADGCHGGYFSGATQLTKNLDTRMNGLLRGDENTWVSLIGSLEPTMAGEFHQLDLCPLHNKTLILYKHGRIDDVYLNGGQCRAFYWIWNDDVHIGDNGRWVEINLH